MRFNMSNEVYDIDYYITEYLDKLNLAQTKNEETAEKLTDSQLDEILANLDYELDYFDKASEDYKTRLYQIKLISKTKRYITLENAAIAYYSDKLAQANKRVQKIKDKESKHSVYGIPRNIFDREATKLADKVYTNGYSAIANMFWLMANLVIPFTLMFIAIFYIALESTSPLGISIIKYSFMSYAISILILQYYSKKPRRYDRRPESPISRRDLLAAQIALTLVSIWIILFLAAQNLIF